MQAALRQGLSGRGLREISRFLQAHDIRAAFGEQTWAFELATRRGCCKAQGRGYFVPATVRVPSDRFGFFTDHSQTGIYEVRKPDRSDREAAEAILEALRGRTYRPYYFHINNKIRFFRSHWLGESVVQAFSKATDGDETLPTLAHRSRWRFSRIVNTYRVRWQKPFERDGIPARALRAGDDAYAAGGVDRRRRPPQGEPDRECPGPVAGDPAWLGDLRQGALERARLPPAALLMTSCGGSRASA